MAFFGKTSGGVVKESDTMAGAAVDPSFSRAVPVTPAETTETSAGQGGLTYRPSTSTSENLEQLVEKGSAYLTQAEQAGMAQAARRGLQNTALAGQAATGEAIRAAGDIAAQDASAEMQKWQLGATVSSNLQGNYTQAQQDILNQYAISVNEIETAENITAEDKNSMIENSIARRDADMSFLQNLYNSTPGFNTNWDNFPRL